MRELSLLEDNENLQFMYSDAIFDIKAGIYALTDKHLILYNEEWNEKETIIEFNNINFLEIEFEKSSFIDSYITVETKSGIQVVFPVSSEKGRDRDFYNYLSSRVKKVD